MRGHGQAEPITFAVVGHNEGEYLPRSIGQAAEAARDGDRLLFVDGASTDGSAELARSLGAEVVEAPLGKGRAVAAALARCETDYLCLVDGDIEHSERNIPQALRDELLDEPAHMILGDFDWRGRRMNHSINGVYRPLVGALFPEALERFGRIPYSGFRILRADLPFGALPPRWDDWLEGVMQVLVQQRPPGEEPGEEYLARLEAARSRPFPPAR